MENYTIIEGFERSRLSKALKWNRIEKQLRLPLAIGLVIWTAWIWQITNAYPKMVVQPITTLVLSN